MVEDIQFETDNKAAKNLSRRQKAAKSLAPIVAGLSLAGAAAPEVSAAASAETDASLSQITPAQERHSISSSVMIIKQPIGYPEAPWTEAESASKLSDNGRLVGARHPLDGDMKSHQLTYFKPARNVISNSNCRYAVSADGIHPLVPVVAIAEGNDDNALLKVDTQSTVYSSDAPKIWKDIAPLENPAKQPSLKKGMKMVITGWKNDPATQLGRRTTGVATFAGEARYATYANQHENSYYVFLVDKANKRLLSAVGNARVGQGISGARGIIADGSAGGVPSGPINEGYMFTAKYPNVRQQIEGWVGATGDAVGAILVAEQTVPGNKDLSQGLDRPLEQIGDAASSDSPTPPTVTIAPSP